MKGDRLLMDPTKIIEDALEQYLVRGKQYHSPLPVALARWYCYTIDGGHSIMVAVAEFYRPGADPDSFLVPAPVKTVLAHPWHEEEGYVVVEGLRYDSEVGLRTPPADNEF